jgi:hypothetical protein
VAQKQGTKAVSRQLKNVKGGPHAVARRSQRKMFRPQMAQMFADEGRLGLILADGLEPTAESFVLQHSTLNPTASRLKSFANGHSIPRERKGLMAES